MSSPSARLLSSVGEHVSIKGTKARLLRLLELFIYHVTGFFRRVRLVLMEKESLIREEEIPNPWRIWRNVLIILSAKIYRPLSEEGITYINWILFSLIVITATFQTINIPIINITVPYSISVPIGLILLFIANEYQGLWDRFDKYKKFIFSRRDTNFNAIINGEKSEEDIELILSNTKFTPEQYKKINQLFNNTKKILRRYSNENCRIAL